MKMRAEHKINLSRCFAIFNYFKIKKMAQKSIDTAEHQYIAKGKGKVVVKFHTPFYG
jgi:hypothetical protein